MTSAQPPDGSATREPHTRIPEAVVAATLEAWHNSGQQHWLPILGGSMWPLLRDGDRVRVVHGDRRPVPGDIVVFRSEERLVAHRVLRCLASPAGPTLLTQGDNTRGPDDQPVNQEDVLGRVTEAVTTRGSMALDGPLSRAIGRGIVATSRLALRLGCPGGTRGFRQARALLLRAARRLLVWRGKRG